MGKFFGKEILKRFVQVTTTVARLNTGSLLKLGGQAYELGELQLDTGVAGVGGMQSTLEAGQLYYVYIVPDGSSFALIATVSNIMPNGFDIYRKVGAFSTSFDNTDISDVYFFGSTQETRTQEKRLTSTISNTSVADITDLRFDNLKPGRYYKATAQVSWVYGSNTTVYFYLYNSDLPDSNDDVVAWHMGAMASTATPEDRWKVAIVAEKFLADKTVLRSRWAESGSGQLDGSSSTTAIRINTWVVLHEFLELDWTL